MKKMQNMQSVLKMLFLVVLIIAVSFCVNFVIFFFLVGVLLIADRVDKSIT